MENLSHVCDCAKHSHLFTGCLGSHLPLAQNSHPRTGLSKACKAILTHHTRRCRCFKVRGGLSLPSKSLWSGGGRDRSRSKYDTRQGKLSNEIEVSNQKMNSELTQEVRSGQRKRDRREKRQLVCLVNLPCLVFT